MVETLTAAAFGPMPAPEQAPSGQDCRRRRPARRRRRPSTPTADSSPCCVEQALRFRPRSRASRQTSTSSAGRCAGGTKAPTRDRAARVAEWAWPYPEHHLEKITPGERLLRGLDSPGAVHRARPVGIPHHRMHDARHFYAIRTVRAGTPYELVARQLGHADVQMVATRYGRYAPQSDERDRWEKVAAQTRRTNSARDRCERRIGEFGCIFGCTASKTTRANHNQVIGSSIAGVGLEPTTPAL